METTTEKDIKIEGPGGKTPSTPTTERAQPTSTTEGAQRDSTRISRYGDPQTRGGQAAPSGKRPASGRSSDGRHGGKRPGKRGERQKPEFDQKIISIRRVTRVVSGGRRFSFSVALVTGDKNGSVGVGIGKASDTALAIEKAFRDAKQSMVTIKRTETGSIPHDIESKYTSSRVLLRPSKGKGLIAGSSVRTVLELGGIKDVSGKLLSRSKNKLNNARATVKALEKFGTIERRPREETATETTHPKQTNSAPRS